MVRLNGGVFVICSRLNLGLIRVGGWLVLWMWVGANALALLGFGFG